MPETFRRGRIAEYIRRLIWRQHALSEQLQQPDLAEMKPTIQAQIQALDMVIREMIQEFEIQEEDLK